VFGRRHGQHRPVREDAAAGPRAGDLLARNGGEARSGVLALMVLCAGLMRVVHLSIGTVVVALVALVVGSARS
jgi:hypothetical protein